MDLKKKKSFNEKMGKRQNFSKGGLIKKIGNRTYFAEGGNTTIGGQNFLNNALGDISGALTVQDRYNANLAPVTQYDYGNAIGSGQQNAINGYNQFNQNLINENQLNTNLGNIALGQGPNPAQAMLNQATGQNISNQAALMAGQRGASNNVGLIARQAAQQGAQTQQHAVGQGATMQAQQRLGALGQQAGLQGQIGNQITSEQNANTGLLNAGASANTAQNNTNVANYGMAQGINADTAQNNANAVNDTNSGILSSIPIIGKFFGAHGGRVVSGPYKSHVANFLAMGGEAKGVPAMVSPGEVYLSPDQVKQVIHEGADPLKIGERFKGKAKVKGDSLKNDTIPKTLEEGGVVIDRKNVKHRDKAELFVRRAVHMHSPKGRG